MKEEERDNCHHCVANEPLQANLTDLSEPHKGAEKSWPENNASHCSW